MGPGFRAVTALSIIACYVFYSFEWLFFVTKPSMFSLMSAWESFRVLLISPLPLIAACLVLMGAFGLLSRLFEQTRFSSVSSSVALLVPAVLTAAVAFLLIENFTYTILGFNVGSFHGPARYLYALLYLILLGLSFRYLSRALIGSFWSGHRKAVAWVVCAALSVSTFAALSQFEGAQARLPDGDEATAAAGLPNILILSADGVNAGRMSAYGYHRDTTPFIRSLFADALVFENAFTNSVPTTGSNRCPLERETANHHPSRDAARHLFRRGFLSAFAGASPEHGLPNGRHQPPILCRCL